MGRLLAKRVGIAWLLLTAICVTAFGLVWKVAVLDAPPTGAVIITPDEGLEDLAIVASPVMLAELSKPTPSPGPPSQEPTHPEPTPTRAILPTTLPLTPTAMLVEPTATVETLAVYVSGAVKAPGVYTLAVGARVGDAIAAAGGPLPEADMERINLAARVADEDHISVLRKGEATQPVAGQPPTARPQRTPSPKPATPPPPTTPPEESTAQVKPPVAAKINVNTATAAELETLPGVGPVLAQRIMAYRERYGPFKAIEDLMKVPGIKEAMLRRLQDYVTVGE